jgi:DNA gyrase subunit A
MGSSGIKEMYRTGRGSFIIRSKAEIEEYGNGKNRIVVTEIPYQVNKAKLIIQIADLVKAKRIEGISDIKEESDRTGMRVVIELKNDANPQVVLNLLYKHTELQVSFGAIMLALVDSTPKVLNLKEILTHYLNFQVEVIKRRTKFDLDKAEAKAHILRGLVIAQANIDEVIRTIKLSDDKNDAIEKLTRMFELTEKQATAILDMRLQRLTGLEVEKLKEDLVNTEAAIKEYKEILADENKVLMIIKHDVLEIKEEYAVPRKSQISYDYSDIDIEDLIPRENVVITMTHSGYIKRMPVSEYKAQHRGGIGVIAQKTKEEDFVESIFTCSTHDSLFCFSNFGRVYTMRAFEVPESQKQAKGRAMVNLLQLNAGERITAIMPINREVKGNLMMATKQGLIKKTSLEEFESIRKNGKIAIKLNEGDELINVDVTNGDNEVIMASSSGKCIRFHEKSVRSLSREAMGVKSIRLNDGEVIVDMAVVKDNCEMLTISELGYGKRTSPEEYRVQGRNGKGIKAGIFNEQTGNLVNLKQVTADDDIMLITDDGQIIRVKACEINIIGRNTKGVRIMKLRNNRKIIAVAVTPSEEEEAKLAESMVEEVAQAPQVETIKENLDIEEDLTEEVEENDEV